MIYGKYIDPAKVILVANSNVSVGMTSRDAAAWYCARRGIPQNNIWYADFGTSNSWTSDSANPVLTLNALLCEGKTLGQFALERDAEAFVASIRTPWRCTPLEATFESILGQAMLATLNFPTQIGFTPPGNSVWFASGSNFIQSTLIDGYQTTRSVWVGLRGQLNVSKKTLPVPAGRLGKPSRVSGHNLLNEPVTAYQTMVNYAIAVEGSQAPAGTTLFGIYDRGQPNTFSKLSAYGTIRAMQLLESLGFAVDYWCGPRQGGSTYQANSPVQLPQKAGRTNTDIGAGTQTPKIPFGLWLGTAYTNWSSTEDPSYPAINNPCINSFQVMPGAFSLEVTSFGLDVGSDILNLGGSLAVGTSLEPLEGGVGTVEDTVEALLDGASGLDMRYRGAIDNTGGRCASVWGDPLHSPLKFRRTNPTNLDYVVY